MVLGPKDPDRYEPFQQWEKYNREVNEGTVPDRRHQGNPNASAYPVFEGLSDSDRYMVCAYLATGQDFMNFCDDLRQLALRLPGMRRSGHFAITPARRKRDGWLFPDEQAKCPHCKIVFSGSQFKNSHVRGFPHPQKLNIQIPHRFRTLPESDQLANEIQNRYSVIKEAGSASGSAPAFHTCPQLHRHTSR